MATASRVYSPQRLRLVLIVLALIALPFVVGSGVLIYYYARYSAIVDKRLSGERASTPATVYSRPVVLRPGYDMTPRDLARVLNGLRYEEKQEGAPAPGEFVVDAARVLFTPRDTKGAPQETIAAAFEKDKLKALEGQRTRGAFKSVTLESQLITQLSASREKRRRIRYEELPKTLIEAVLAIEDRRFFSHPGLDPFRIVGAAVRNYRADSYIQGGSTITQQLVKNFFLTPQRTMKRKVQEALIAFILERHATKQEIFELYLNEIYLGQIGSFGINGVGEAAHSYFRKDVTNLTLEESALLAGMIQSPNPYNPFRHPERAKERRAVVLRAMEDSGFIADAERARAQEAPLVVEAGALDATEAPYFVEFVQEELAHRYDLARTHVNDLVVRTSLDVRLQAIAQRALSEGLAKLDAGFKSKRANPLQGALVALEPKTGAIVAFVGGRAYGQSQYDRVTQAKRQTGSTFKPFVYLAAFESGFEDPDSPPITPATVVDDTPSVFFYGDKEYMPENYEDNYMGPVTMRTALAHSLNVATVKVAEMVGFDAVARTWNKKIAVGAPVKAYPAVALGAFEATPMEMIAAYNVLANDGVRVPPMSVAEVDGDGSRRIDPKPQPAPERAVRAESSFMVVNMMRSVLNYGTAGGARRMGFTYDGAGKTGTTNDLRDAWFAGFVPNLLCVVWVGYDDNTPVGLSGAKAALPIWVEFMRHALAGGDPGVWRTPPNIVFLDIDRDTGLLAGPGCTRVIGEAFVAGTEPHEVCQGHSY